MTSSNNSAAPTSTSQSGTGIAPAYGSAPAAGFSNGTGRAPAPPSLVKDNLAVGLLTGFLAPAVVVALFYVIRFREVELREYFDLLLYTGTFTQVLSVAAVSNLGAFYFFLNRHRYQTTKGVILATLLLALVTVYFKVVG